MRYRIAVEDKELFAKYIYKSSDRLSLASFEEKDKEEICSLLCKEFYGKHPEYPIGDGILKWFYSSAVDEKGVLYIIDFGKSEFTEYGRVSSATFVKAVERQNQERDKMAKKSLRIREDFSASGIVYEKSLIPRYKKGSFFDVDAGIEIPFRFRVCKGKEKMPLLVYLHGAGSIGSDNVKPLAEFKTVGICLRRDCFVLIPQCDNFRGDNLGTIKVFAGSVKRIVRKLAETYTRPE